MSAAVVAVVQLRGRVLPSTYIAGTDVSMVAPDNLDAEVQKVLQSYQVMPVQIEVDGQSAGQFQLAELGVSLDPVATAERIRQSRLITDVSPRAVWSVLTQYSRYDVAPVAVTDSEKVADTFARVTKNLSVDPMDANLNVVDGEVVVTPSSNGYQFSLAEFAQTLSAHVAQLSSAPVLVTGAIVMPLVHESTLVQTADHLRMLLAEGIELTTPNFVYKVTPGELGSWIVPADPILGQSGFTWNDELIHRKIRGIAKEQDREAVPTKVIGNTDTVVEAGIPGVAIDQEGSYEILVAALLGGLQQRSITLPAATAEPPKIAVSSGAAPTITDGKQIVVVLSEQRLYAWNNGQLDASYLISSGLTYPTPVGDYAIQTRYPVGCMSGPDYHLCDIHWIQYFTGAGHSFHEAWWHNNFGHPMSHGCVNMTYDSSKWLYDWATYGTPIHIVSG